jgi:formylmethanofuran dehydrogenase subunit D
VAGVSGADEHRIEHRHGDRVKIAEARAIEVVVTAMKAHTETKSSCRNRRVGLCAASYGTM